MEPAFTVFKVPFWNLRKRMKGRRISHIPGMGRLFLLMFGYESETAKHLFVSKIYIIAAQSFPFKVQTILFYMRKGVWCRCVLCYRNMDININTSASFFFRSRYIAICFFVGCALDHSPLRLPNTRTKLWSKKCVFWYMELSSTTASLLTEEAHNNLGIFCFTLSFIKLSLVCLNQKQILK